MIPIILFINLQAEIRLINLLHGLELDSNQCTMISEIARTANGLKQEFETKKQGLESDLEPLLLDLKDALLRHGDVPNRLARSIHQIEEKILLLRSNYHQRLDSLCNQVRDLLTPEQYYALEHYKPCLIPAKGEARIGQSEQPIGVYNLLNRIRRMPGPKYRRIKDDIVDRIVEKIELHKPIWVKIDHDQLKNEITRTLDEARSLSDINFALKRDEFVDRLKKIFPKPESDVNKKIARFLLTPEVVGLLKTGS